MRRGDDSAGGIAIRPPRKADVAAIAGLITELGAPTTPADMAQRMAAIEGRPDHAAFVAVLGGQVAGFIGLSALPSFVRNSPNGRIIVLTVGEAHRRQGVGRALIAHAEAWFAERGVARISLTSGSHRPEAHAFYRACGYADTGLRFVRKL